MRSFLKNHPFAVEAHFDLSLVVTFAAPQEAVRQLVPECFTLDTLNDTWAFIAVALVQTKGLRPKGFPRIAGQDFFLAGYRIFVRFRNMAGRNLRGLYILKSETDKRSMELLGNLFTHYSYTATDILLEQKHGNLSVSSVQSGFNVIIKEPTENEVFLPEGSPFAGWKEARRFAGPLPFTFSFIPATQEVLTVEGVREYWKPQPVAVVSHHFSFLDSLKVPDMRLASTFMVRDIPYHWKRGKTEVWRW